jgi:hypothetical protein
MALPILINDGPILIETPVAERAFADLAAIPFDNFIKRRKHRVGHSIFLVVQTRIDAVMSLTEKGPNGSADHPPTELRIRGLV